MQACGQARLGEAARYAGGRLLREAISLVLADVEENGENSALVRRLNEA